MHFHIKKKFNKKYPMSFQLSFVKNIIKIDTDNFL